jgi:DNA-directed RNA polymerase alpha subunit
MGDANFIEEDYDEGPAAWREIPLKDLHLTLRSYNCLRRAGICTLGQLAACRSLSGIRNLNRECRKEIAERVLEYLPPEEICFLQELDEEIIKDIIPDAV